MYHMFTKALARFTVFAVALIAAGSLSAVTSQASELVMFEGKGCVYCHRWDRDVGTLYNKTAESKDLPLRRLDISEQKTSGVALASPVRYTPTFIIVDNGREIGRITGYINDDAFWGLLGTFVPKLAIRSDKSSRS